VLVFLKLGGSLITDKSTPDMPRLETLRRLAGEIAAARAVRPGMHLLLGHGSGSFGHAEARKHGTRAGVAGPAGWNGFARVSAAAARLNRLVADALLDQGVPAIAFQPSASAVCRDGTIEQLALEPIRCALENHLCPLVYGDVALDRVRGGTIISTEDIFRFLARALRPERILLAGIEAGVYGDWPHGRTVMPHWPPANPAAGSGALGESHAPDVTGGMASKVAEMLALCREMPGRQTLIFSGEAPGNVFTALTEARVKFGTVVSA
jgi:isopentenyl phosphate kinase